MTSIRISIGGTGGTLGRYTPLPRLGGSLFAGYLLGTDYFGPGRNPGTPLVDLSGHGRAAVLTGAGPGPSSMTCSPAAYLDLPFRDIDVGGAHGAATVITVAAIAQDQGFVEVGAFESSAPGPSPSSALLAQTGTAISALLYPGAMQADLPATTPRSAAIWEVHAATYSPGLNLVYRRRAGLSGHDTVNAGAPLLSTKGWRIGAALDDSPYAGTGKLAAVLVADRKLTVGEVDAAYVELKALLGPFGIAL